MLGVGLWDLGADRISYQTMLEPSIAGSLPKPSRLAEHSVLRAPWRLSGDELRAAQDDAVRLAVLDQEEAGLAVVTDGEVRRRHYIWGFLDGLTGIDTEQLAVQKAPDVMPSSDLTVGITSGAFSTD